MSERDEPTKDVRTASYIAGFKEGLRQAAEMVTDNARWRAPRADMAEAILAISPPEVPE